MANQILTIDFEGLIDAGSQKANTGDVKKSTSTMIRLFLTKHSHLFGTIVLLTECFPH